MQPVREECFLVADPALPFTAFVNKGAGVGVHWHTYIEMLYVISGKAVITIGAEKYDVEAGDFLIINSHEAHSSAFFRDISSEILVIQFEPHVINPSLGSVFESKYMIPFLQREIKYSKHIRLEKGCSLQSLLIETLDEYASKQQGYELNVKGNIYKVFSWLIRNNYISVPSPNNYNVSDLARLKPLMEYIEINYMNEISNNQAANLLCMSYHYFCRFFKRVTGKTFKEYLNYVRLCEAEKLLLLTDESISLISHKAGFPSLSYFNRLFKKEKAMSPTSFKRQNSSRTNHN